MGYGMNLYRRSRSVSGPGSDRRSRNRDWHRLRPVLLALEDRRLLSTFTVSSLADSAPANNPTPNTLRWAVEQADAATSASTINFNLGSNATTIILSQGALELSNTSFSTTITGPGASLLSVSGNQASSVLQIDQGVTASISGLTITGGSTSSSGGGVFDKGTVTLANCTISGNTAANSGGDSGGGGVYATGTLTITDCTISNNTADSAGGVSASGKATITGCTISGNSAENGGGGGLYTFGNATITGCTISGNSTSQRGGGLVNFSAGTATITSCTISSNTAVHSGGGVLNDNSAAFTDCTLSGNTATATGGGIYNVVTATFTGCTLSGNTTAGVGGAVLNLGTSTLSDCTLSGNSAAGDGGGLDIFAGSKATITGTIVAGNIGDNGTGDLGGTVSGITGTT